MKEPLKIAGQIKPTPTIERVGSQIIVALDGKPVVTLHYDYAYMDNATQWSWARSIVEAFGLIPPEAAP
ncbi:hypothetical protein GJ654_18600 [Rhodoblastus acidophilus]|uniref:Uncharacterized protein n=1 Tax=Rhodoblastus acidophilus TaxID=1074 RepID=A0A6N8DVV3_RHOAC|nr:hypothetical protein [Rhodoblastus acidophilus]MCW2276335.1 hypothetical protein [Rhodoblastus acidophilus]MTV32994.1 hypothetical protein [Rhodoblastus acidophilus]